MLFRRFLGLQNLDFPNNFPVKDQDHIANHTEHKNFNTNDYKKHRKNGEGNVINSLQPFM